LSFICYILKLLKKIEELPQTTIALHCASSEVHPTTSLIIIPRANPASFVDHSSNRMPESMTNTSYHTVKLSVLGTCKLIQMSIHSNTNAFHPILGVSSGNYQGTVPTIQFYFIKDGCFPLANMTFGNSGESVGTTLIHRFNYRPYCNLTMDSPTMQLDHSHHHSI